MAEYYLDVLSSARNYQASILGLLRRWMEGPDILDFGAGHGDYALQMHKLGFRVDVLEPDTDCQAVLASRHLNRVERPEDCRYNAIYSLNVFEHIPDDRQALRRCFAALKSGGRLFLYVPAHEEIWTALDDAVGHQRRYTQDALRSLLTNGGFRVVSSGEHDCAGYWVSRWLARNQGKPVPVTPMRVMIFDRMVFPLGPLIRWVYPGSPGKNVWIVGEKLDV
ncbi:MAG: class I SAM-dependent methyltransferase [Planctomycetia bacterium]|nr:class I SAM-dependent methyltransferase [Planctomycetia bacterium]